MKSIVRNILLSILGNFLGILIASLILPNFKITGMGIFTSVLIFTILQIVLAPFVSKLTKKYAPSLSSLIALATTFFSLLFTAMFTSGLRIGGLVTWISASVLIWLLVEVLGVVLPKVLFPAKKKKAETPNHTNTDQ